MTGSPLPWEYDVNDDFSERSFVSLLLECRTSVKASAMPTEDFCGHMQPPMTDMMAEAPVPAIAAMIQSNLANQRDAGDGSISGNLTPVRTPQKSQRTRSLSDSTPQLSPSPKFREPVRAAKDDHTPLAAGPRTPRRPDLLSRGLSLQMPAGERELPMPSPAHFAARVPLSPQLDAHNTYASPASLLPRRSRGAEFSRACTNLHHSTLADQPSPDSSPTVTQKGMTIPARKQWPNAMVLDSPNLSHSGWGSNNGERTAASSSVGSINMLDGESSSSSDEGDLMDPDDQDDPMLMTPQAMRANNMAFGELTPGNGARMWSLPSFMSIQRARLHKGRSRKSSSSASGRSSMPSPVPTSPPNGKSEGYFARETAMRNSGRRRESLSMFANDLHLSSGNDSGDEAVGAHQTPGVVRRPVTRRGNLLVLFFPGAV